MSFEEGTDEQLIEQCRTGAVERRRELANVLFARYYERVGRWCFRFTGDRELAADTAQEVFAKAYSRLDSFQGAARFSTWLYVIARNECLNVIESRARQPNVSEGDEVLNEITDPGLSPSDAVVQEEISARLRKLLNESLDQTERVVFTLHFADELGLDAITRVLNLTNPSGAKAYIVSAKRKLARAVARLKAKEAI